MNSIATQTLPADALITGEALKASIDDDRQLWVNGKKLVSVFDEPALAAGIDLMAGMFDDQFKAEFADPTTTLDRKRAVSWWAALGRCQRQSKTWLVGVK